MVVDRRSHHTALARKPRIEVGMAGARARRSMQRAARAGERRVQAGGASKRFCQK
jgi:hypothetical protein